VVGYWRGYLSGARCRLAYGPADATVSCFSKIQIDFTFLVPAHPGSPGKRAVKRVRACVLDGMLPVTKAVSYFVIITGKPPMEYHANKIGFGCSTLEATCELLLMEHAMMGADQCSSLICSGAKVYVIASLCISKNVLKTYVYQIDIMNPYKNKFKMNVY